MFLGPDGWHGIDIGPVGSAVLYTALWLFAVHLSKHSDAAFPADAPLAERQGWVSVVFVLLIAIHWLDFLMALRALGAEADQIFNSASRAFGMHLGMLMVGWIVLSGIVRAANRDAVRLDERDLRIQHAADRASSGLVAMLIVGLILALVAQPGLVTPWLRPMIVANVLAGLLVAKALTENVYIVARYRRELA